LRSISKHGKKSKMIIIHVLEPFASGITTAVSAIAGELKDFKHIVIHGSRNWTEDAEKVKLRFPQEVTFIEWKNAGREISLVKDLKAYKELISLLKPYKNRKDKAVHLHSSKAGFLGRLACRKLGIKEVIYTPHCGAFLRTDIGLLKKKLYHFFEKIGGCFGGRVVGCGKGEAELYKKFGKNTTYVSNGVKLKDESVLNNDRNLIAFTGIVSYQKDPALWSDVAAACDVNAKKEGFSFSWVGDGPLANLINKDYVTLTGWKNALEVEQFLEKTAVYFSASAWEGLPYGVLEAMNMGCALLLRNVPGNSELVVPGENGWLFNTSDEAIEHLNKMIKNKPLLKKMGYNSRELIKKSYTIKLMGDGYRKIYNEIQEKNN